MKKCFFICQITFVGLALFLLSSCATTHYSKTAHYFKKNYRETERWVHRLYKRNGNAFYITSTYSNFSYVWTYKEDEIEIRRLLEGKVQGRRTCKGNKLKQYDEKTLADAEKELEEKCPFELDGDYEGYIIQMNGKAYEYSSCSSVDCMRQNVYDSEFLNDIVYVITILKSPNACSFRIDEY